MKKYSEYGQISFIQILIEWFGFRLDSQSFDDEVQRSRNRDTHSLMTLNDDRTVFQIEEKLNCESLTCDLSG